MTTNVDNTIIPTFLKLMAIAATSLGTTNILLGTNLIGTPAVFRPKTTSTALAESQIRYLGGVMAATGPIIWWASNSVAERLFPLACIAGGVFVGGVGRAIAASKHGFAQENVRWAMWIEFVGPVLAWALGRSQGVW